jgi:hypothetical protein
VSRLIFGILSVLLLASASAQDGNASNQYLHWSRQQAGSIGKSTCHDGKVGASFDTRLLKTERSVNYKLRATWFTPEVIHASARWAQLQSHLTDKEAEALVSEADAVGATVVMVELDPNEGSGVIPNDWEAYLRPKGSHSTDDGVRGVEKAELRKVRALQGVTQRNYDYDRFWVVFPLIREDGDVLIGPAQDELELVVRIYNKQGTVKWVIPPSIRSRTDALKAESNK